MAKERPKTVVPERVGGLADKAERAQALETIRRAFSHPERLERHMAESLWRGPVFDPEHTRVVVVDGRVVSTVVIAPRMIRFGSVEVPAMTVGPVATHDKYRKRNLASVAMEDANRYMREHGVLVAYLQGIPNFYYRFGYYPFLVRCSAKFKREKARKEALPGRFRGMTTKDLPKVRSLYQMVNAGRTGSAVRDDAVWNWLLRRGTKTWLFHAPKVILDGRSRLCGYVTFSGWDEPHVSEIVVKQDEASCRAALGALVREAKRRETKEINLARLPWDDGLAVFLRHYVDAEFTLRSASAGGPLMLIVDFPALMKRLEPLFAQRWTDSNAALPEIRFTLATETGAVGFSATRKGVTIGKAVSRPRVRIPQRWLSGLLTGYYAIDDVAPRKGAKIPPQLKPVLEILFPAGWPFVYQGDDY